MDLAYQYDPVGNILGLDNLAAVSKPNQFGGRLAQTFGYDDLYRLTSASGSLKQQPNTEHRYALAMQYDEIHNIVGKNQKHVRITPGDGSIVQRKTTYDFQYAYAGPQPHAPTLIGDRAFSYDANGNQTGWDSTANGHTMRYIYNDAGERVFKTGPQGETAYVSQFYSVRNREVGSKHIFIGTGRIATKMVKGQENAASGKGNGKGNIVYEKDIYYYHPDHLGSSTFISAADGELYQHLENFPFGETWVEESSSTQRTPYHFTAKELDEETGLYYFGGRYYDPRTSVWQSTDPILADYLPSGDKDKNLPGNGGVFSSVNVNLYHYAGLNPVKDIDPDGRARFYKRPLGNISWLWLGPASSNPLNDVSNTEISHEHIFYDDAQGGNIGFGPDGTFSENSKNGYRKPSKYYGDSLIRESVSSIEDGKYSLLGILGCGKNNCQDWAERVRKKYDQLEKGLLEGLDKGSLSASDLDLLIEHAGQMKDNSDNIADRKRWNVIEQRAKDWASFMED